MMVKRHNPEKNICDDGASTAGAAALPKRLIATADVVHDLQRQNAIPEFLTVVYCEGDKRLNVE